MQAKCNGGLRPSRKEEITATSIKEKIEKLLALASSPNENEAKAALLKAKELMAKHKLTEDDFKDEKSMELVHLRCESANWTSDSGNIWMTELCKLLCDNYCCVASWLSKKGHRTYTLVITGLREDAELCRVAIEYAVGFINSQTMYLLRKRSGSERRTVITSYATGFISGLEEAFEEQKDEHPEWGLVVVKPDEVSNYENSLGSKSVKVRKSSFDPLAYLRGQKDGKEFNAKKVLEG